MSTKQGINIALRIIGLAGFAGVAVIAPNAIKGLDQILNKTKLDKTERQRILAELKRQGLVHIITAHDSQHFTITPAGAHRLQQANIDDISLEMPKKWDKRWRLVTFDIPVRHSAQRQAFTSKLKDLGFVMLQRSLWVHPAPCFEQIETIAGHYNVMRFCTLLEITRLDDLTTKKLLRIFDGKLHT